MSGRLELFNTGIAFGAFSLCATGCWAASNAWRTGPGIFGRSMDIDFLLESSENHFVGLRIHVECGLGSVIEETGNLNLTPALTGHCELPRM